VEGLIVSDGAVAGTWPAVAYEQRPWERDLTLASRTARSRHRGPYQAAVPARIAGLPVSLPGQVAAEAEEAAAEIARFDAELGRDLAPFAAVLLRTESAASSKIENLTASARAIAQAEIEPAHRGNAPLIVANERAMSAAIGLAHRIDAEAILTMHEALLGHSDPGIAGRWRQEQVWIGGGDFGPHGALFVPPHSDRVPAAIDDLVAFIDRDDVPVLAHAAVAHAQFETIHPFPDGNGRVGRAIVHAHLRAKGLTRSITVPVSAGLLAETDTYFHALDRYRDGGTTAIIAQFTRAAFAALGNARRLAEELHTLRDQWQERISARRDAVVWRVADLLLRRPVVTAAVIADELGIAPQNTHRSVQRLVAAGVVVEFTGKQRNRMWRAPEVLEALDRFAVRAGRRGRASV
jgi:Fic family protein